MTDEQKARDIIAGIHADLASRGDPGTPYRSVREVYEAKAAAEAGTPIETKQIPGTTGTGRMRTTDPLTGKQYGVTREMLKAYGVQKDGIFTGEMDWKSIHRDAATASFWKAAESGQINSYDDIKPLAAQFNNSAPAGNALKAQFDDYWNLPARARNILIGTVDYEGKKGIEGLNAWFENEKQASQDTQTRRDIAEQALKPAIREDGSIDTTKLAGLIGGSDKRADIFLKHLYAMGYSGKTPISIIDQAKKVPKYEYDTDTMHDYLRKSAYEEGTTRGLILDMLPGLGTARLRERYFKDRNLSAGEAGWLVGSTILDVASIAPIVKAASIGAKGVSGVGRGARMKGAAQGIWKGTVAEVSAPVTMVLHPVETAKGTIKGMADLVENLAHPSKIPVDAAEITTSTTRLDADIFESDDVAKEIRDRVTQNAISGIKDPGRVGEVEAQLSRLPISKGGEVCAVHSTPDIRPFLEGTTVQAGREGGLFVSPSLHTRFTKASAFGDLPQGNIPGALLIRDKRVVDALEGSNKIFKGTAEIERVIPEGIQLDAPSQILFTRDAQGNVLKLLVIGKPYTKAEIASMKLAGMVDTVTTMFKPAASVKGGKQVAKSYDEVNDLRKQVTKAQDELAEVRKSGDQALIKEKQDDLARLEGDLQDAMTRFDRAARNVGSRRGVEGILTYTAGEKSPLSTYRDTVEGKRSGPGRYRMPDIDLTGPRSRDRDRPGRRDEPGKPPRRGDRPDTPDRPGRRPDRPEDPERPPRRPPTPPPPDRPPDNPPDTPPPDGPPPDGPPVRPPDNPPPDRPPTKADNKSKSKDEEEEKRGKTAPVAFRMGEVTKDGKREDVYVVAHDDGKMQDEGIGGVRIVIGDPPAGVPKKGSPQDTLTVLGKGQPPEEMVVNIGNQRATIKRGQKITFEKRKSRKQPGGRIAQRTRNNGTIKRGRRGRRTPGVIGS